jgi:glycosyltransferase involved in cell wall biosynthesis
MVVGNNPSPRNPPETQADQGVSIIIPAYNEEKAIEPVLSALRETMSASGMDHEILVIDDGSSDRTGDIAGAIGAPVKVVSHDINRGYGAALKTGIRAARFPLICITDADGTYPNDRIPELIAHYSQAACAMVVGSRTGANVAIPFVRKPAKWAIGKLASYIVGERIPDINSGLRVFPKDLARRIFPLLFVHHDDHAGHVDQRLQGGLPAHRLSRPDRPF